MLIDAPLRSIRDRVLIFRSLPSFAPLDDDAIALLAEHSKTRRFHAGDAVLREGEPVRNVYIVLDGQLTSRRRGVRIAVVGRARGVGLLSVAAGDTEGVDVVADVDTLTLEIPSEAVVHALEEDFSLLRNALRLQASELVRKRDQLPVRGGAPPPTSLGTYRETPLTLVEQVIQLSSGVFENASVDALLGIVRATREARIEAGELLWRVGDPAPFWFRLEYGRVRCTSAAGASVEIGPPFVLGIMDVLGQLPRSFEARAETKLIIHRLELSSFLAVLENHFDLARGFLRILSRGLLETPSVVAAAEDGVEARP